MPQMMLLESRRDYAALQVALLELSRADPAENVQEAQSALSVGAPVLHCSSGGWNTMYRRKLLRCFNDRRDYNATEEMLKEPSEHLGQFQLDSLMWVVAVTIRSAGAEVHKRHAFRYRETAIQKAAYIENVVFEHMMAGRFAEATRECRAGLLEYPTSHGLWVNLLVSLSLTGRNEAIDKILLRLPEVLDVEEGLLGVYLRQVSALDRPACNGG